MKFFLLLGVGALANQAKITFTADPDDAMGQLSMIMASSQKELGRAQRRYKKVIDKMDKVVAANFDKEAELFGEQIGKYVVDLADSSAVLQTALDSGYAGLKVEEKVPSKPDDWNDPGVAERAEVYARLNSANRTVQHLRRTHDRDVEEAEDDASQAFDDASMKLSRKLGDMSDVAQNATKSMKENVDKFIAKLGTTKSPLFVAHGKDQQSRLKSYEQDLEEAQSKSMKAAASARKSFSTFLAKNIKTVESAAEKVLDDLSQAQQKEIEKIAKHEPTIAPALKKQVTTTKTVAKSVATTTVAHEQEAKKTVTGTMAPKETKVGVEELVLTRSAKAVVGNKTEQKLHHK